MASVHDYLASLQSLEAQVVLAAGTDPTTLPPEVQMGNYAVSALVGVLIKCLVDNGRLTDAQLQATVALARAETWTRIT